LHDRVSQTIAQTKAVDDSVQPPPEALATANVTRLTVVRQLLTVTILAQAVLHGIAPTRHGPYPHKANEHKHAHE